MTAAANGALADPVDRVTVALKRFWSERGWAAGTCPACESADPPLEIKAGGGGERPASVSLWCASCRGDTDAIAAAAGVKPRELRREEGPSRRAVAASTRSWPAPPAADALHGLAGDVVRTIGPHSEADEAALLLSFLAAFGNACGRGPGFRVEGDFHATNLYVAIVGDTSKGRKGTSWGRIRQIFERADPDWMRYRVASGLSSGEGLIWQVRDEVTKRVPVMDGDGRKAKPTGDYTDEIEDPGVEDKRLLIQEGELAQVLHTMKRSGSTVSAVIRNLWDHGDVGALTKNTPARTTGALVSIVGHIASDELRRELTATDAANGFANRFLFACSRRSNVLPDGGALSDAAIDSLADRVRLALEASREVTQPLERTSDARELWHEVYENLSEGRSGLVGKITSRAEAQAMRLAVLYALLDHRIEVDAEHLCAGLAVWDYCERTAEYIFGDALGNALADKLLAALQAAPGGLTRSDIRDIIGNAYKSERIEEALTLLKRRGLATVQLETGRPGRPPERWFAVSSVSSVSSTS